MPDLAVVGLPKSGTTALTTYVEEYTGLEVSTSFKHRPGQDRSLPCVHIVKHIVPWTVSWVDWPHSGATLDDLERFMFIEQKAYDWAARARLFDERAVLTLTHRQLVTQLSRALKAVEDVLGVPHERPNGKPVLADRRYGSPSHKGPFDPTHYEEREYLEAIPDGVLPEVKRLVHSQWGHQMRDRFGFDEAWWRDAVLKPP